MGLSLLLSPLKERYGEYGGKSRHYVPEKSRSKLADSGIININARQYPIWCCLHFNEASTIFLILR
jgi:hypothetical protein